MQFGRVIFCAEDLHKAEGFWQSDEGHKGRGRNHTEHNEQSERDISTNHQEDVLFGGVFAAQQHSQGTLVDGAVGVNIPDVVGV